MNTLQNQNHPLIVFSLALAAILMFGGILALKKPTVKTQHTKQTANQAVQITKQKETVPREVIRAHANTDTFAYAQGPKDASVTVVEYFDFLCPFSKQSAQTVERLTQTYATSSVRFVFRQAPAANVYPASLPASNASLCANEQGKFFPMYSLLFGQQKKITAENFSFFAYELGLDKSMFDACMDSRKYQKWISKDLSDAVTLGLNGTPTWFINEKRFVGAMPFDVLSQYIQDELTSDKNN
ncbi:DsbA family protein [Candidatus Uhrbacteria bacterium]|nr:DsbA family protein [Candidatus Uhrbacteria bacterium]